MPTYRLTKLAETDLLSIGKYTLRTWGPEQTIKYLDELETACQRLVAIPTSGRRCDDVRPGLYRSEVGMHVLFFRRVDEDIVIVRVLHQQMLPKRHSFNDGADN